MGSTDKYRNEFEIKQLIQGIQKEVSHPWKIMEVCGNQTHTLVKSGIMRLLPKEISIVHGPGCPACVTSLAMVDNAIELSGREGVILATFEDMLSVPGSRSNLLKAKTQGAAVSIVESPLEALDLAQKNQDQQVVFFAVGFEAAAPANAVTIEQAKKLKIRNFSVLCSQLLVPPMIKNILSSKESDVQAILVPAHVCSVMGYWEYEPIAWKYKTPIVVTGFEPIDLLEGVFMAVMELEKEDCGVLNQYTRAVHRQGNSIAQNDIRKVFTPCDREWRGIGLIRKSGLCLSEEFTEFDAVKRFDLQPSNTEVKSDCISGSIMHGNKKPTDCPAFGTTCTPENPLGSTMASSEGACVAYYQHQQS